MHLSFPWSHPWAFAVTTAIMALCPQDILYNHCCFLLFLLFSILSKGVNPLLPDFWGSEPAVYPTMSRGLCFSEQGLCAFLYKALLSACVCDGAAARPCRAAEWLLLVACRRGDLEAGPSRASLYCLGAAVCGLPQNILSVISSCFSGSLLIFHWGTGADCKAHASKEGSFQQLWG